MIKESKVYFISGLGADKRVFANLKIDHPSQTHIEWEIPSKKESMQDYCRRLLQQVDLNSELILIGVSFGGVVAQEIAKITPVSKIIIISSIKNKNEKDWKLRCSGYLKLHSLFPEFMLKFLNKLTADYYFGIKNKEESKLLHKIIDDANPLFNAWAIDQILKWDNKEDQKVVHIHGTSDRIFPFNYIKNSIPIENGGHFMVYNKANEISELINKYLKES